MVQKVIAGLVALMLCVSQAYAFEVPEGMFQKQTSVISARNAGSAREGFTSVADASRKDLGNLQAKVQGTMDDLRALFSVDNNLFPTDTPLSRTQCATFMDDILYTYTFTPEAATYIQKNVTLFVSNETTPEVGGGWWVPRDMHVLLNSTQHECAVHEFAHAWYDNLAPSNPNLPSDLVNATLQLASMDPAQYPQYAPAIAEAQRYVDKGWTDSAGSNYAPWEIYASFASFTMGQVREGESQLPEDMWYFYDSLFQNEVSPGNKMPQKETAGKTVCEHAEVKAVQKEAADKVSKLSGSLAGILSALDAWEMPSLLTRTGAADEVPASFIVDRDKRPPSRSDGSKQVRDGTAGSFGNEPCTQGLGEQNYGPADNSDGSSSGSLPGAGVVTGSKNNDDGSVTTFYATSTGEVGVTTAAPSDSEPSHDDKDVKS